MRTRGLSQPVHLEKNQLHLKRACQRETAKAPERARAGTPWVLAPLQCEWTHAWVTHWQAQWKDSQSQSADGGYSGLVTWDIEEIQRNNLSMPNTLSQRRTGRRCSRIHSSIYIYIYIYITYISHICGVDMFQMQKYTCSLTWLWHSKYQWNPIIPLKDSDGVSFTSKSESQEAPVKLTRMSHKMRVVLPGNKILSPQISQFHWKHIT